MKKVLSGITSSYWQVTRWLSGFSWLSIAAIVGTFIAVIVSIVARESFETVVVIFGVSLVSAVLSLKE